MHVCFCIWSNFHSLFTLKCTVFSLHFYDESCKYDPLNFFSEKCAFTTNRSNSYIQALLNTRWQWFALFLVSLIYAIQRTLISIILFLLLSFKSSRVAEIVLSLDRRRTLSEELLYFKTRIPMGDEWHFGLSSNSKRLLS